MRLLRGIALLILGCNFNRDGYTVPCVDNGGIPTAPDASSASSSGPVTYALDSILVGDADRGSVTSTNAWKTLGFNLDGLGDGTSTDACRRAAGAPSFVQADGQNSGLCTYGIDNSFGANIVPIFQSLGSVPNPTKTNGTVGGVLAIDEFIDDITPFAQASSKSLCGSALDGIDQQIRQCVDILDDGTNAAGKICNAISIGVGFTAKRIANPKRTDPPDPTTNLCMPSEAGAD